MLARRPTWFGSRVSSKESFAEDAEQEEGLAAAKQGKLVDAEDRATGVRRFALSPVSRLPQMEAPKAHATRMCPCPTL